MSEFKHEVLIIGGDSRIGTLLKESFQGDGADVASTTRRDIEWNDGSVYFFDLGMRLPHTTLPLARFTYFCAAIARFKDCEANPEQALWVNARSPAFIAEGLTQAGGRVVLLSSAAVETHPHSVYGQTKIAAERAFLKLGDYAAAVRFGPVIFPGRDTYQDYGRYQPILPADLIWHLKMLKDSWIPGVHCIRDHRNRHLTDVATRKVTTC